jgi:hypothetical protein
MKTLPALLLSVFLLPCAITELDIEIIILDDKNYSESKFIEAVAQFNPIIIENGTARALLLSPPTIRQIGFINPVICVGGKCYDENDLPAATPAPTPAPPPVPASDTQASSADTVVIASVVSSVVVLFLGGLCYFAMTRKKRTSIASRFRRVVIRETIDLHTHLATQVKLESKHTRCFI